MAFYDLIVDNLPVPLKEGIRRGLTRTGMLFSGVPDVEWMPGHLRRVFDVLGINCVVDVGAHRGQYGRTLRNIGYEGRIVSFEPLAENIAILQSRTRGDANWRVMQCALGDAEGEQLFQVAAISQFSSFLRPSEYSAEEFGGASQVARTQSVPVRRLDAIIDECLEGLAKPRVFLKMDTQGYDTHVFRGATGCLDVIAGLQSELSVRALYEGMPSYVDSLEEYRQAGFEVTGFFPVVRARDQVLIEMDCVMRAIRHPA